MKVLVTGANGQLGYDVIKRLNLMNIECLGIDIKELDITVEEKVISFIKEYSPDVVIHCAAYTAVDKAEESKELCYKINVCGTRFIAKACSEIDAIMVYISTDYVFNGEGLNFFSPSDKPEPINYYGKTKYEGELEVVNHLKKHFIVRISWVFGINGNNFVKTMLRLGKERSEISVVCDQIGSPTYTYDLAKLLSEMIGTDNYGIYHATNEGICSWYEFACEIFKLTKTDIKVNPITTDKYPTPAIRPKNSRMSKSKLADNGFSSLRDWKDALKEYIETLQQGSNT